MPIPLPEQLLRGIYAALVRDGQPSPAVYSVKNYLNAHHAGVYNPPTGAEIKQVEESLKKGPFPTAGMVQFSFAYWYNYFFKELPNEKKVPFAVKVVNDDGTFRDEHSMLMEAGNPKPWKAVFKEMLALGFKEFQVADKLTADEALAHAAGVEGNELQRQGVQVVFRGDGRKPDTIQWQRGTARQSKVEALRTERNMTQPWHPFNKEGNKVWVRNGANADNCLFSAVSITPQFGVATKFPLLDDLRGSNPAALGHSLVMVRPRGGPVTAPRGPAVAQRYLAAVGRSDDGLEARTLLASQTNIYCVRLRDVYNTQNYQGDDAFPEYATTRISWMDHLVWFAVTRIHFNGLDGNAGHLVVITEHKWLQDPQILESVLLKQPGLGILRTFVKDVVTRGSLSNGSGGIVYTPPGIEPPFDIVSIRELFIQGRPQSTPPTAPSGPQGQPPPPGKVKIPNVFTQGS
jgi:hypothetical protein